MGTHNFLVNNKKTDNDGQILILVLELTMQFSFW